MKVRLCVARDVEDERDLRKRWVGIASEISAQTCGGYVHASGDAARFNGVFRPWAQRSQVCLTNAAWPVNRWSRVKLLWAATNSSTAWRLPGHVTKP